MSVLSVNFLYACGAIVIMYVAFRLFQSLSSKIDYSEEIKRGNVAAAIVIGALFVAIAIIFAAALN